jgi:hypothetical protein
VGGEALLNGGIMITQHLNNCEGSSWLSVRTGVPERIHRNYRNVTRTKTPRVTP